MDTFQIWIGRHTSTIEKNKYNMRFILFIKRIFDKFKRRKPSVWDIDDYEPLQGEFFDGDDRYEIE